MKIQPTAPIHQEMQNSRPHLIENARRCGKTERHKEALALVPKEVRIIDLKA